jgi:acyl carrier protein
LRFVGRFLPLREGGFLDFLDLENTMIELQRLREAFRTSLDLPAGTDVDNLHYQNSDQWDSLAHMSLVAAIEDEFSVMMDTDDVINMSSFNEAVRILGKYGVDFNE